MMRARFLTAAAVCFLVTTLVPARASAQSEVVEYYALDAIGSVRVVFDANGAIKSRRDYAPFGEEISSIATNPKVYAGLFRDDESTLDYAEARMYQSNSGRFTAVDPGYSGLFAPQKWNRYAYALNNPLTFVDVNGLEPCGVGRWCVETVDDYLRGGGGAGADLMYVMEDTKTIPLVELPTAPQPPPILRPDSLPEPPTPDQTPAPDAPDPSPNDCQRNARMMGQLSQGTTRVGEVMMDVAKADPWRGRSAFGFRSGISQTAASDVYRHLWGHGGAAFSVSGRGLIGSGVMLAYDVKDVLTRKPDSMQELAGSMAGLGTGAAMTLGSLTRSPSLATAIITTVTCR